MKKYFLLMAIATSSVCFAQKEGKANNPTEAAKATFTKSFPGASKVKWEKEDGNYEATFQQEGKSMSAVLNVKGELLETETTIKTNELPAPALLYIKDQYKGGKVKEAAKITKANGEVNYEAEVGKVDVIFDAKGKFIKEEKD